MPSASMSSKLSGGNRNAARKLVMNQDMAKFGVSVSVYLTGFFRSSRSPYKNLEEYGFRG
jgi:hypothetical protein